MKKPALLATLMLFSATLGTAIAQPPPAVSLPDVRGTVSRIESGVIVVGDRPFIMRPAAIIENQFGQPVRTTDLVPGLEAMAYRSADSVPGQAPLLRRLVVIAKDQDQ